MLFIILKTISIGKIKVVVKTFVGHSITALLLNYN